MQDARKGGRGVRKAQSAIEYLSIYGWAALLIAIVMIVLFELGVFNTLLVGPRVQPGSCQVTRPNGPGTTYFMRIVGACNGALPEYVMVAHQAGEYVEVANSSHAWSQLNVLGNQITVAVWVDIYGAPYHDVVDKEYQYGMKLDLDNEPNPCFPSDNTGLCLEWDTYDNWAGVGPSEPIPGGGFDKWIFLAATMNGKVKDWYANGNFIGSQDGGNTLEYVDSNLSIGAISTGWTGYGDAEWFNGTIANVQVYNTSLTPNEIEQLYVGGIGSPPISLSNLVGWWPLNGNGNDYSGNNDSALTISNVSFTNDWTSQYAIT